MNIQSNIPEIAVLRERVEARLGKRLTVHSDFLELVSIIEMEQRQHISETTIERVWGYSTRGYSTVSLRTLNVLATYATGEQWLEFCQHIYNNSDYESQLFNIERIATCDLEVEDRIEIGWMPNRRCIVRYVGNGKFIAEECNNSKMQPGDSFECREFAIGKELKMSKYSTTDQGNSTSQTYVVGIKNGLTILKIL